MKWITSFIFIFIAGLVMCSPVQAEDLILKTNLQLAKPGDYIVMSAGRTHTLLHIYSKQNQVLTIEEIAVPARKLSAKMGWKEWVRQGAPGHNSWVMYDIDLQSGQMLRYYSFTKKNWFEIPDADNFLSKLLNLKFTKIPENARKKSGNTLWQPRMVVEGKSIEGIPFDAWRTKWPRDNSDLSGKVIEAYLPIDSKGFPAYFPYWLQINGTVGQARVHIIDAGSKLQSPKPHYPSL